MDFSASCHACAQRSLRTLQPNSFFPILQSRMKRRQVTAVFKILTVFSGIRSLILFGHSASGTHFLCRAGFGGIIPASNNHVQLRSRLLPGCLAAMAARPGKTVRSAESLRLRHGPVALFPDVHLSRHHSVERFGRDSGS